MKSEQDVLVKEIQSLKTPDEVGAEVLSSGLTITQTNEGSALITENLYRSAFERGIAMFYRDDRSVGPDEFIRANPDGSEDLVTLNAEQRSHTLLKHLLPAGQGQLARVINK